MSPQEDSSPPLGMTSLRGRRRSEEHTYELQSHCNLVCRLLLEKKKKKSLVISPVRSELRPFVLYRSVTAQTAPASPTRQTARWSTSTTSTCRSRSSTRCTRIHI